MSFAIEHLGNNLWRGKFSTFTEDICQHGFSARLGGISVQPYKGLNMALHVGDEADIVWENRKRFFQALGLKAEKLVTPQQVHGAAIQRVTSADAGRGAKDYADAIADTDALITNEPGLPLMLCFADCVPVIFLDPEKKAVGIAHAGWKGTVAQIARDTVLRMQAEFASEPADILAGIGPSIGPCCFAVGEDVAEKFRTVFSSYADGIIMQQAGQYYVNLWEANRQQLLAAGLAKEHIEMADTCTDCQHQWFYSYRADSGQTGRMAAIIALNQY
ncbi:MAG: peptidoglycan editing factor PgeF [Selenomonas sp.]|uniref:peptidoglycan editing factor PgeF n=1 Tax=Selenomonas sp. TaxID=2053611 RepID=UPI0025FDE4CC|nr:peptidoglycan editing factor PgeF [Selenomonas sp.]MCR5757164.1 peptidoglycan editing factor PgeF [Selenomonas sp.]